MGKEAKISLCFLSCLWWLWFIIAIEETLRHFSLIPIYWVSDALNGSERSKFAFKGVSKGCVDFWVNTPDVSHYRTVSFFCSFTLILRENYHVGCLLLKSQETLRIYNYALKIIGKQLRQKCKGCIQFRSSTTQNRRRYWCFLCVVCPSPRSSQNHRKDNFPCSY